MSKHVKQAAKIVSKATNVFGSAITSVERANNLLAKAVEDDNKVIDDARAEIEELKLKINDREVDKRLKLEQIGQNNDLIDQLTNFVPTQK